MKKIYSFIGAVAITASAVAQQSTLISTTKIHKKDVMGLPAKSALAKPATAVTGDTVAWSNATDFAPEFAPNGGPLTIYGLSGDGGYIYGKNGGGISCFSQAYFNINNTPLVITKAIMIAAAKEPGGSTSNPNSVVTVGIWSMAANKAYNAVGTTTAVAKNSYGPNALMGSTATIPFASMDTSTAGNFYHFSVATFATPVNANGDFAIVVDCNTLAAGDTVGMLSDKVGDANGIDMTFHRTTGGNWYVTDGGAFADGALNNDVAVFAVLGVGTAVQEYVNGVKLSDIYPNPATESATLAYSLEKDSKNVSFVVYDMTGKKVYEEAAQDMPAGSYKVKLNTASFNSGSYFYQLRSNGSAITKELVITK